MSTHQGKRHAAVRSGVDQPLSFSDGPAVQASLFGSLPEELQIRIMSLACRTTAGIGTQWPADASQVSNVNARQQRTVFPLVCKAWKRLCESDRLWGTLVFDFELEVKMGSGRCGHTDVTSGVGVIARHADRIQKSGVLSTLAQHGSAVRDLSIQSWCQSFYRNEDYEDILEEILELCPNLERLHVKWLPSGHDCPSGIPSDSLAKALAGLPRLLSIRLDQVPTTFSPEDLAVLPAGCPELEELELVPSSMTHMTQHEGLTLYHKGIQGMIPSCWGQFSKLRRLSLGCVDVNGFEYGFFGGASALEELDFPEYLGDGFYIPADFSLATSLRVLSLNMWGVTDIPPGIWELRGLRSLELRGLSSRMAASLARGRADRGPSLLEHLPELIELHLAADLIYFPVPLDLVKLVGRAESWLRVLHLDNFELTGGRAILDVQCMAPSAMMDLRNCRLGSSIKAPLLSAGTGPPWVAQTNRMLPLATYKDCPDSAISSEHAVGSIMCCIFSFLQAEMDNLSQDQFRASPFTSDAIRAEFARRQADAFKPMGTLMLDILWGLQRPHQQEQDDEAVSKEHRVRSMNALLAMFLYASLSGVWKAR